MVLRFAPAFRVLSLCDRSESRFCDLGDFCLEDFNPMSFFSQVKLITCKLCSLLVLCTLMAPFEAVASSSGRGKGSTVDEMYCAWCMFSVMSSEVIEDITQEVLLALEPYGGAVHVHVDKLSTQGNVYVKSISIAQGEAAVNALHKRHFSGEREREIILTYNCTVNQSFDIANH